MAGLIQLSILALAMFGVVIAAVITALYPCLRRRLIAQEPAGRARGLFALCLSPVAGAIVLTALCFLPSLYGDLLSDGDHCAGHGAGHLHFCALHVESSLGTPLGWAIVGLLLATFAVSTARRSARMAHAWRSLRQATHTAAFDSGRKVCLVESDLPLAVTTGIRRSRILLSTGLIRALPAELVDAVVEHERAHARRGDVLSKLIAGLLSFLHLPSTRRRLLADLALAMEQACDEEASERLGDRLCVARALLCLHRQMHGQRGRFDWAAVTFGGPTLAQRVESLLAPPKARASGRAPTWLVAAVALLAVLAEPLHHHTETILGLITR